LTQELRSTARRPEPRSTEKTPGTFVPRLLFGSDWMTIKGLLKYLPVLSIVLVAGILLVIVVLFTLRNINAQNERMEELTRRQGESVIRALEAGTRTGFMEGDWGIEHLQMLIEQAAKDPDVEWVGLINSDGKIIAHSEPAKIGLRLLMGTEMNFVKEAIRTGEPLPNKKELRSGRTIFEIWKPFTPFSDQIAQTELIARHTRIGKELLDVFDRDNRQVVFLGLKMDRFKEIRQQDLIFAIFMGAVLFMSFKTRTWSGKHSMRCELTRAMSWRAWQTVSSQ
jgi:two-component system, NtrC family, sensor histidine kinase HydH